MQNEINNFIINLCKYARMFPPASFAVTVMWTSTHKQNLCVCVCATTKCADAPRRCCCRCLLWASVFRLTLDQATAPRLWVKWNPNTFKCNQSAGSIRSQLPQCSKFPTNNGTELSVNGFGISYLNQTGNFEFNPIHLRLTRFISS